MNIALLLPDLCGGGAERVASELSRYFTQKNHHVFVFTRKRTKNDYAFAGKIIQIPNHAKIYSGNIIGLARACELLNMAKLVRRLKKKYRINVTISFMENFNCVNILSKHRDKVITRICTILSVRENMVRRRGDFLYNRAFLRFMYSLADKVVVLTQGGKMDMVNEYRLSKQKIAVVSNPLSSFAPYEEEEWPYGDKVVLCPLRVDELKQQKTLVECFKGVLKEIPEAKLLLVGRTDSSYADEVKKLVRKLHLEKEVLLIGHSSKVQYYLEHSTCFILISKGEGFSSAIVEALGTGLPVLSTDCPGGPREILAPGTGLGHRHIQTMEMAEYGILLPYINEEYKTPEDKNAKETISKAIVQVLTDPELRKKYSEKGRERAKCYSMEIIGARWEKLIHSIVK